MKFLLSRRKSSLSIGSKIIMWAEKTNFSHSAILINGFVYEAVFPKARSISFVEWSRHNQVVHLYAPITCPEQIVKIEKELSEWVGYRYSVIQVFIIGLGLVKKSWDRILSRLHLNGRKYLICTELCGEVLQNNFGVTFDEKLDTLSVRDVFSTLNFLKDERKWQYLDLSKQKT
jgi:hypothetical protein